METQAFSREITLPDGWKMSAWDMTLGQFDNLQSAYASSDYKKVKGIFMEIIKSWDVTDKDGVIIPVTPEGLDKLTMRQLKQVTKAFYSMITDDYSKNAPS
jgi:hypothetical protein